MEIEFAEPRSEDELEQYYKLRYERLRKESGEPMGSERDHPAEPSSSHLVAKVGSRVVGAVCWAVGMTERDGERLLYVRLRQLAVDAAFEGQGIGGELTRRTETYARDIGASEVVTNARVVNVPFFERQGFEIRGEGESVLGIEHVSMAKPL